MILKLAYRAFSLVSLCMILGTGSLLSQMPNEPRFFSKMPYPALPKAGCNGCDADDFLISVASQRDPSPAGCPNRYSEGERVANAAGGAIGGRQKRMASGQLWWFWRGFGSVASAVGLHFSAESASDEDEDTEPSEGG